MLPILNFVQNGYTVHLADFKTSVLVETCTSVCPQSNIMSNKINILSPILLYTQKPYIKESKPKNLHDWYRIYCTTDIINISSYSELLIKDWIWPKYQICQNILSADLSHIKCNPTSTVVAELVSIHCWLSSTVHSLIVNNTKTKQINSKKYYIKDYHKISTFL